MRAWLALALATAVAVPPAQIPARDASRTATPAGTASVSGIVLTGDAPGRPLRRVTVTLQSAALTSPISTVTDDDGRFLLTGVAAGQYLVRASRDGYVDTVLGAEPGGFLGAPIAVHDGEPVTGLSIHVPRGGVITGTVRSPSGTPARDVQVMVSQIRTVNGERRTRLGIGMGGARTDDRGVYREFGLPPGEYVVQVVPAVNPLTGAGSMRPTSPAEVAWAERLVAEASAPVSGAPPRPAPPPGRPLALAPIYYPGARSLETAQSIALGPAEERTGVDLVMAWVPTARVTGTVRAPDGSPRPGTTVRLMTRGHVASAVDVAGAILGQGLATSDAAGAFAIDGVPPGDYTLVAQATRPTAGTARGDAAPPNLLSMLQMVSRGTGDALHASAPLTVTGTDVEGVELRLADGATVSGRVVFEGDQDPPAPSSIQILLAGVSDTISPLEQAMAMVNGASATVGEDYTFAIRGVPPNRYRATATMPGTLLGALLPTRTPAWVLKSIRGADGIDVADVPFTVEAGRDIDGLVVTITDRPTVVSGRVLDGGDRPVSAFPILVFSTDPAHWTAGSRRVQQARPASDGTYRIAGLPAGEYYVGAVTTLELDDLYDPSFLQQIVPIAFRITIADGETRTQDLRIGG